jgi:hypothetical protein
MCRALDASSVCRALDASSMIRALDAAALGRWKRLVGRSMDGGALFSLHYSAVSFPMCAGDGRTGRYDCWTVAGLLRSKCWTTGRGVGLHGRGASTEVSNRAAGDTSGLLLLDNGRCNTRCTSSQHLVKCTRVCVALYGDWKSSSYF